MSEQEWPVRQEPMEVQGRPIFVIGALAITVGAVGVFFGGVILVASIGRLQPNAAGPEGVRPGPTAIARVLQTPIWETQAGIDDRQHKRAELEQLGWENRAGGMARIPIEDAIDLVVKEQP